MTHLHRLPLPLRLVLAALIAGPVSGIVTLLLLSLVWGSGRGMGFASVVAGALGYGGAFGLMFASPLALVAGGLLYAAGRSRPILRRRVAWALAGLVAGMLFGWWLMIGPSPMFLTRPTADALAAPLAGLAGALVFRAMVLPRAG